eukprot:8950068-Alexandrium_andersonii.AAC.1
MRRAISACEHLILPAMLSVLAFLTEAAVAHPRALSTPLLALARALAKPPPRALCPRLAPILARALPPRAAPDAAALSADIRAGSLSGDADTRPRAHGRATLPHLPEPEDSC